MWLDMTDTRVIMGVYMCLQLVTPVGSMTRMTLTDDQYDLGDYFLLLQLEHTNIQTPRYSATMSILPWRPWAYFCI